MAPLDPSPFGFLFPPFSFHSAPLSPTHLSKLVQDLVKMKRHWMGGSRSQLHSTRSHREIAQREFFQRRRDRMLETSDPRSFLSELEACRDMRTAAEMAAVLPSHDLKLLASFSNAPPPPSTHDSSPLAQPTAMYPTSHPQIFTSIPPNRLCNFAGATSVRGHSPLFRSASSSISPFYAEETTPLDTLYRVAASQAQNFPLSSPAPTTPLEFLFPWCTERPANPMSIASYTSQASEQNLFSSYPISRA